MKTILAVLGLAGACLLSGCGCGPDKKEEKRYIYTPDGEE